MTTHANLAAVTAGADDRLLTALAGLATAAPADLGERIFARFVRVPGPVGPLFVAFTDQGISYVRPEAGFGGDPRGFAEEFAGRFERPARPASRPPAGLITALRTGRAGNLRFDLSGLSDFEQAVLTKASDIPRGETRPYGWVASEIGRPGAVRAAGSALGRNPVPVLIPCHRVVRSDGQSGEYIFGAAVKDRLLRAENANLDETQQLAGAGIHFLASDTTGVVCYPACHAARRITPGHRVGFRTMAKALAAGYQPCLRCRPVVAQARTVSVGSASA